jgi:hypothetical protein
VTKTEAAFAQATVIARRDGGVPRTELTKTLMRLSHWGRHMWRHMHRGERLIMTKAKNGRVRYAIEIVDED